uniref:Uncharacterized protein n=2 Tax=Phaeomonas parva TaxID=124430 RepID=A0A7S1UB73_9STRA|mmetsp:Transcript_3733/g.10722  ORF Transcript_3733/g.10722 Transcript_3733/m.10722 type:complete len:324 (+) Transcript_3733:1-972(+)
MEEMRSNAAEDLVAPAAAAAKELKAARDRMQKLDATAPKEARERADWSGAYSRWDDFEDVDDLELKEKLAREKRDAALERRMMGGCAHDHSTEQAIFDLTTAEKTRAMEGFRRHGNEFFREGQWQRALGKYQLAMAYFEYAFPDTDEEERTLVDLRVACLLNACLCNLRMRQRLEALNMAQQAVREAPGNAKAYYRKAQVLNELDRLDEARADAQRALELKPGAADIRRELNIILSKESAARENLTAITQTFLHVDGSAAAADDVSAAPAESQRKGTSLDRLLGRRGQSSGAKEKAKPLDDLYEVPPPLDDAFDALRALEAQV